MPTDDPMSKSPPEADARGAESLPNFRLGFVVIVAGLLLSGIAHGYLDGRWAFDRDLATFGEGLAELPETAGTWNMSSRDDLDPQAQRLLRCHGSMVREYVDDVTGRRVSVAVLFGPRGPIAVHTPEVCYSSVGTDVAGPRETEAVTSDDTEHTFWRSEFVRSPDPDPSFEVWYAWSDGGRWEARDYPRFWMTDNLFKIQLAGPPGDDDSVSACRDFLIAFLPELNRYLSTL